MLEFPFSVCGIPTQHNNLQSNKPSPDTTDRVGPHVCACLTAPRRRRGDPRSLSGITTGHQVTEDGAEEAGGKHFSVTQSLSHTHTHTSCFCRASTLGRRLLIVSSCSLICQRRCAAAWSNSWSSLVSLLICSFVHLY